MAAGGLARSVKCAHLTGRSVRYLGPLGHTAYGGSRRPENRSRPGTVAPPLPAKIGAKEGVFCRSPIQFRLLLRSTTEAARALRALLYRVSRRTTCST